SLGDHGVHAPVTGAVLGSGATALSAGSALIDLGGSRIARSARSPHKLAPLRELAAAAQVARPGGGWSPRREVPPARAFGRAPAAEVRLRVVVWDSSWQLLAADALVSALATEGAEQVAARWTDRSDLPRPGVFLDVLYDPWPAPLARVVTALGGEVADGLEML